MKTLRLALSVLALCALTTGCIIDDSVRSAYEGCASGQACAGGTFCTEATFTTGTPGVPVYFCTFDCSGGAVCPAVGTSSVYAPTCVINQVGVGQCYDTCGSQLDCGLGTTCGALLGTSAQVCVPDGS